MSKINFKTKSEMVLQKLKHDIFRGRYQPEQKINICEVARGFGVSEIPVREALKKLESEGLIRNIPHIGPIVTSINMEDIEKIFPIRMAVEGLASRLSARKLKESDFEILRKIVEDIGASYSERKYESVESLNRSFHTLIISATENEYLIKNALDLRNLCFKSFKDPGIYTVMPEIIPKLNQDHGNILEAIMSRDGTLAERLTISHMEYALEQMRTYHKSHKTEKEFPQ